MKEVTLKFREVAVEGNPKESGDYAVIQEFLTHKKPNLLMFSAVHGLWNALDFTTLEEAEKTAIRKLDGAEKSGEVSRWMPIKEFTEMMEG